jgi:hypothetical protein
MKPGNNGVRHHYSSNNIIISEEIIVSKIYLIRGKKVMIDRDLALLYGVETRALNQTVKRNPKRFPDDFMFQMSSEEMENWKSQIVISNQEKMGLRKPPLVFTEQGNNGVSPHYSHKNNVNLLKIKRK